MDLRFGIIIAMGISLFVWVVFCAIQFVKQSKEVAVNLDYVGKVKCEKCGIEYEVSAKDFNSGHMVKSKSITRPKRKGIAIVRKPEYSYYAKKFYCPNCHRKEYARVLNIDEINNASLVPAMKLATKWFMMMLLGGSIVFGITSVSMKFADYQAKQKVEDLKEQHYEELKEKYGIE